MITREILAADPALSSLSEEQITSILALNANDISAEIGKKTGEIYRLLDATIEEKTGIKRNGAEKSYLYLARAMDEFKQALPDVSALETQIITLKNEKADLEGKIAAGAGEETRRQLTQVQAELENTKKQYADLQNTMTEKAREHEAEIFGIRVEHDVMAASKGLTFKKEIPSSVVNIMVGQAVAKVKSMNPDYIEDGNGGKRLVFRGEDGAILNNPANKLSPFTADELLTKELTDILQPARRQEGTGTGPKPTGTGNATDISGARTRMEAHELITQQLLAQGLTIGSEAFDTAMSQAWTDNNISALPER